MYKLSDYLNKSIKQEIVKGLELDNLNNHINLYNIKEIYEKLLNENDGKNIIILNEPNNNFSTKLDEIFVNANNNPDEKYIILSLNPDMDYPPFKEQLFNTRHLHLNSHKNIILQDCINKLEYTEKTEDIKQPNNVIFIGHSVGKSNDNIFMVPLGRDIKAITHYHKFIDVYIDDKDILCYYNCSLPPNTIQWYGRIREYLYVFCMKSDFVLVENCIKNPRPLNETLFNNYFNKLKRSKFMLCPRGCGIDTYRMWSCIFMGCIPIVEKFAGYTNHTDLPILYVDNEKDYYNLTKEYLEKVWVEYQEKEWNYTKLNVNYWYEFMSMKISEF